MAGIAAIPHIFDSVLDGTDQDGSDFDLLVDVLPGVALFDLGNLQAELEAISMSKDEAAVRAASAANSDDLAERLTVLDCLIIGAGPGRLTAAIYLRRFHRDIMIIDKGESRLSLVPVSHNYPGFVEGVHGATLLQTLKTRLGKLGCSVTAGEVTSLGRDERGFVADWYGGRVRARKVIMATGIIDIDLSTENWHAAIKNGAVRLCPICDGYDVTDRKIAVVCGQDNRVQHARFMRTFSADITLMLPADAPPLEQAEREALDEAGVAWLESPALDVTTVNGRTPLVHTVDGKLHAFEVLYPMMGEIARSSLGVDLGARVGECGDLVVDRYQRTSFDRLYAVGDVVVGVNQISG